MERTFGAAAVLGIAAIAGCGGHVGPSAQMSLRRVVLYQNGLGHFERTGDIDQPSIPLRFSAHEIDDVLATMTLESASGEPVVSASVPQRQPDEHDDDVVTVELRLSQDSARDLRLSYSVPTPAWRGSYRVVLPDEPGEGEALFQIWALVHNASPEDWNHVELALSTGAPISYEIDQRTPEFIARPTVSGQLVAPTVIGTVIAESSRTETDGDGIEDAADACPRAREDLDGWQDGDGCPDDDNDGDAIVDAGDHCPNGAEVRNGFEDADGCPDSRSALTAGAVAIGASSDHEDRLAGSRSPRAEIAGAGAAATEREPASAHPSAPGPAASATTSQRIADSADPLSRGIGPTSIPIAVEGTTRYDVAAPVSIPAHSSSLVTILSERVRGESVLLFAPNPSAPGSDTHPFRAARIQTPRTTTLIPGPVAILAGGSFVGQGLVASLHEGETATLPYALEGATRVEVIDESATEPSRLVAIARGVITVEDRSIRRTRYAIHVGSHAPARIFVRHRRLAGYAIRDLPAGTEQTETAALVPVSIESGIESQLVIEESTPMRRTVSMVADLREPVMPYLEASGELPEALRRQLRDVLAIRARVGALAEQIENTRERLADATQQTAELRENIEALGTRPSEARRVLEQRLRAASAEVERVQRELATHQERAATARAEFAAAISTLTLEEPEAPATR